MPERKCTMTEYILIAGWAIYMILSLITWDFNYQILSNMDFAKCNKRTK